MTLRAILFDVDFTLCRPGPELSAERYARIAGRHGITLDAGRYDAAREVAVQNLKRHPELLHDETIWHRFTEEIFIGMGGPESLASECATEIEEGWGVSENFELYEDALPVLEALRVAGLKIGLVSNTSRDLDSFVSHFNLPVDAWISSGRHGKVKPSPSIFMAVLDQLEVGPESAVMVGDSLEDDVEGARALGMQAYLVDRDGRTDVPDALPTLLALPALIGVETDA